MQRILIASVAVVATTGCIGASVAPGERGLKYSSLAGGLQNDVRNEGFYFKWPWNDIITYDIRLQSRTEKVEVLTRDNLHITTNVTVTFKPDEAELYRLALEIGPAYYGKIIEPAFVTITRNEFAGHEHNSLPQESPAIEAAILAKLRNVVKGKPIVLDRVAIVHIEYDPAVTAAISQKLATQQKLAQKDYEVSIADKDADIVRTKAKGDADALEIEAGAQAKAIGLRAHGEAEAIELRGKAQATAQAAIAKTLTTRYLQFKAFDSSATRFFFVPTGKNNLPLFLDGDAHTAASMPSPGSTGDSTAVSVAP